MTARIGAGDTDLGRSIRRVQDLSERILRLNADDQQLLTDWSAVQRADPAYSAALEEFRAASAASARDPATIRQRDLARQFQDLLQRCPPGEKKAGCETSEADRAAMAKELGELSQDHRRRRRRHHGRPPPHGGGGEGAARLRRRSRRAAPRCATTSTAPRRRCETPAPRSSGPSRPTWRSPIPSRCALPRRKRCCAADEALVAILVGSAKSFVWALTRERAEWAEIDAGAQALFEQVTALRNGLDPLAQQDAEGAAGSRAGVVRRFDLGRAHALYRLVLAPGRRRARGQAPPHRRADRPAHQPAPAGAADGAAAAAERAARAGAARRGLAHQERTR